MHRPNLFPLRQEPLLQAEEDGSLGTMPDIRKRARRPIISNMPMAKHITSRYRKPVTCSAMRTFTSPELKEKMFDAQYIELRYYGCNVYIPGHGCILVTHINKYEYMSCNVSIR